MERGLLTRVNEGEQPVKIDRTNGNQGNTELPVYDLTRRQRRSDEPQPLAGSLTQFLTPPGS